jgi:antitoxin YefM
VGLVEAGLTIVGCVVARLTGLWDGRNTRVWWYDIWYQRGEVVMAITASEARKRLFPLIEQVNADQEPVEILSKAGVAYLVSESQWRSMVETAYLLRSPANAARLAASIVEADSGQVEQHKLLQP